MTNAQLPATRVIWVIEDNPDHALLIAAQLELLPTNSVITMTQDGEQALRCIADWPGLPGALPEMVLLDLQLPKAGGVEVLRALRASAAWGGVLVVILSTSAVPSDVELCFQNGANAYLTKGRDLVHLAERVTEIGVNWSNV